MNKINGKRGGCISMKYILAVLGSLVLLFANAIPSHAQQNPVQSNDNTGFLPTRTDLILRRALLQAAPEEKLLFQLATRMERVRMKELLFTGTGPLRCAIQMAKWPNMSSLKMHSANRCLGVYRRVF